MTPPKVKAMKQVASAPWQPPTPERAAPGDAGTSTPVQPEDAMQRRSPGDVPNEDWISEMLELLWPHVQPAANQVAWATLPQLLTDSKPAWMTGVELKKFNLGPEPPNFLRLSSHRETGAGRENVFVEADLEWESRQDIELVVRPLPKALNSLLPDALDDALSKLTSITVGVENLQIRGRMRITLRPLLDECPVVGALLISLVGQPEHLDFKLTLSTGAMGMLPSIKGWLHSFVLESLLAPYILPEFYLYPIQEGVQVEDPPVGLVEVKVLEATHVPKADYLSLSSPFVEVSVRDKTRRRTNIVQNSRHAVFSDNTFLLPVHVKAHQNVTAVLYDWDQYSGNDELGRVVVSLHDCKSGECRDLWAEPVPQGAEAMRAEKAEVRDARGALFRAAGAAHDAEHDFKRHHGAVCQLHLQVQYYEFTADDIESLQQARSGRQAASSGAAAFGNQLVRRFAETGTLRVRVARVERLPGKPWYLGGWARSIMVKARIGDAERQTQPVGAKRSAAVNQELQLELAGDASGGQHGAGSSGSGGGEGGGAGATLEVEVWDVHWINHLQGRVSIPLEDVRRRRRLEQRAWRLEDSGGAQVLLELEWDSYMA